jgi:hypothetical protein
VLARTSFAALGLKIGENELLLAIGEPARFARLVNNYEEREQSHDNRGDALQHEQPLPVGEAGPAAQPVRNRFFRA